MKKLVFLTLALTFCGGGTSQFEKDFGRDTIQFSQCENTNGAVDVIYIVQYITDEGDGPYNHQIKVSADGADDVSNYRRMGYGSEGDIVYITSDHDLQIIKSEDNGNTFVNDQTFCSQIEG